MKKCCFILSFLALCVTAGAQHFTQYYVYRPGYGERQFGLSLGPSFSSQHLVFTASEKINYKYYDYKTDGMLTNNSGFHIGLYYGFETKHNTLLEWGNYYSAFYSINPYSGTVSILRNNKLESHDFSFVTQRLNLSFCGFLTYNINDQFSVSPGVGLTITPFFLASLDKDGEKIPVNLNLLEDMILNSSNAQLDVNIGMKYWFTDEWYVGFKAQYIFASIYSLFKEDDGAKIPDGYNGIVSLNISEANATCKIRHQPTFTTLLSIGYTW